MSFYRTGKQDCANTFDRSDVGYVEIDRLARLTLRASGKGAMDQTALRVAKRWLERERWINRMDWLKQVDYDPEDGPVAEAYRDWRRGYVDCATPRLALWILEALGEAR